MHLYNAPFPILQVLFFMIVMCASCKEEPGPTLIEMKQVEGYPSGSGIEYFNKQVFVVGDDAGWLLIMDSVLQRKDSLRIFETDEYRIPKEIKADLESIMVERVNGKMVMLIPGSGSTEQRNSMLLIDPVQNTKSEISLDTFYQRLRAEGLKDLNIEGSCSLPGNVLLASRGNKGFPRNYLVFTSKRFWEKQDIVPIKLLKIGIQADSSSFSGISGLDYSASTDQLFITVSTENTSNSYEDGSIGKSYLWIINDISSRRRLDAINPDRIIDLEEIDSRFKGHKIESVCLMSRQKNNQEILLVSDDDKGGTVLFRMKM